MTTTELTFSDAGDWRKAPAPRECIHCTQPITSCEARRMLQHRTCCVRCAHPVKEV